ncbi:MAG: VWA domain-containing protein [Pseudomonadota bacterium]
MRATRFTRSDSGPAERVAGFIAHLRMNGYAVGPAETADALAALASVDATDPAAARLAMRSLLASGEARWEGFDDLYDAYWFNTGRQRRAEAKADHIRTQSARPTLWQPHLAPDTATGESGSSEADKRPDTGDSQAEGTDGRLIATRTDNLSRRDLRELVDEESLKAAEDVAQRLAKALRDRCSRRNQAAQRGARLDMRRILRASLARGGEPLDLYRRHRPDRRMRIVALCDVSGSMSVYSRVFLAFVRGLIGIDMRAEAYLFHTRLIRVTDALRDRDSLRGAGRLSLMAEGFGGGTDIAGCLETFNQGHAARAVNGRTVVLVLSDGYCTSPPEKLGDALKRLGRRAGRIVWLNPLLGWKDYTPVARGIAAAMPHLDAHLPANTIAALAALEPEFARI